MMGIVFNLLEAAVCRTYGEAQWYQLLDKAGLDGAYTSIGNYPDTDAFRIVNAASEALQLTPGEVLRWFGRESMGMVAGRYSLFFTEHSSVRTFLPTINRIHNAEVRKLYPGALLPEFSFEDAPADTLRMVYHSSPVSATWPKASLKVPPWSSRSRSLSNIRIVSYEETISADLTSGS